ncbi:MAG: hypothetical protein IKK83_06325 [Clostridia bacterium]|nr:hypothetical protein [Clostridia bacterium]
MKKRIALFLLIVFLLSSAACKGIEMETGSSEAGGSEAESVLSQESLSMDSAYSENEESAELSDVSAENGESGEESAEDSADISDGEDSSAEDSSAPESESSSPEESSVVSSSSPEVSGSDESSAGANNSVPSGEWINNLIDQQSRDYFGYSASELDAYFTDTIITGDSVTNGLKIYKNSYEKGILEGVYFHTGASYGYNNALKPVTASSQHPLYQGQKRNIAQVAALRGSKKIIMGFGLNDFGYATPNFIRNCLDKLCSSIYEVDASIDIIILSSGYFTEKGQVYRPEINDHRTNKRQREYNQVVLDYCNEKGLDYIDVTNCFSDSYGNLRSDITLDNYCHPQIEQYTVWRDILYSYAAQKMLGTYSNPPAMS